MNYLAQISQRLDEWQGITNRETKEHFDVRFFFEHSRMGRLPILEVWESIFWTLRTKQAEVESVHKDMENVHITFPGAGIESRSASAIPSAEITNPVVARCLRFC
ncbi:hypothetical protein [Stieleria marina]|uniref:hypothetical protein n=1 Tax=Stieleria marina TaxID=1930275 RepID=UPI003AF36BD3